MLPNHGPVSCRQCFHSQATSDSSMTIGQWKVQNDPGHWGSSKPKYLVLGFSKGFTQADAFQHEAFENVPFKGMRPRLGRLLSAFGMLTAPESIDEQFENPNNPIAFASLIRCSVSRYDEKQSLKKGKAIYSCTGSIIPKSFKEIPEVITNCAEEFLLNLPESIEIVVLLGNGDAYIKNTKKLLNQLFSEDFHVINDAAVRADGRLWVWAGHPSGLNGHFENWISGQGTPGLKFKRAIEAISL